MNESVKIILPACITAFVTIIGFIVTYFLNKRNFKQEVSKQKMNVNLDKMQDLPYKIQELLDAAVEKSNDKNALLKFKDLMASIFAYGSKDAIKIVSTVQEMNYRIANNPNSSEKYSVIACYVLLICQVKYDLTGIEINPEFWYRMRLNEYLNMRHSLVGANNEIVRILNLNAFLRIKLNPINEIQSLREN